MRRAKAQMAARRETPLVPTAVLIRRYASFRSAIAVIRAGGCEIHGLCQSIRRCVTPALVRVSPPSLNLARASASDSY